MSDRLVAQLLQQSLEQNEHVGDQTTGALIVSLLQRSIEQNERLLKEHSALKATVASHILNEETLVKGLINAFPKRPDGTPDFEGHEEFHTALIDEARARTVFFRELRHDLIKRGLWGLVMILGALIAYWWSGQLRPPP